MSVQFLETLAADFLENQDLVCLYTVVKHGGLYHCALHVGSSDFYFALVIYQEDLVEGHFLSVRLREARDEDFFASFYSELLSCNVNDCVHLY